jgi:hypothetical protein
VLCCAVLCCAVLCCAVLCCAVLCCAVLCCSVLCCAVLCCRGRCRCQVVTLPRLDKDAEQRWRLARSRHSECKPSMGDELVGQLLGA